jgi:tetratricopeptide (TPR) repeat protein
MNLRTFAILMLAGSPALASQPGARELYNEGVWRLAKGDLRDAEMSLRKAAGADVESVQPLALYNLGHVRFRQGEETLRGEGNRQQLLDSSAAAMNVAEEAIRNGGRALESDALQEIIAAYMDARAAQKELRFSRDETSRTLGLIGSALERWRRSVGDFHSALELDAANGDAKTNAEIVERKIEELLKFKKQIEQQSEQVAEEREKIKDMKKKLRGKIPKDMQRESDDEEDDDDDEEKKEPEIGQKQQQRIGSDREVSPDMARWLKETMKRRTMSLGTKQEGEGFRPTEEQRKPSQRKGRDW